MEKTIKIQTCKNNNVVYEECIHMNEDLYDEVVHLIKAHYTIDDSKITCASFTNVARIDALVTLLDELKDKYEAKISKRLSYLNDMKCARRNSQTVEDFLNFSDEINRVENQIDSDNYLSELNSLHNSLLSAINIVHAVSDLISVDTISIMWREDCE